MHCPRCGNVATGGQQFCRSCGLSLEKIAELIGDELSVQSSATNNEVARLRARQQKLESWAGIAGLTTFGLILLMLVIVVASQMIAKGGLLILVGLLFILLALGAGAMGFFQFYSKALKDKLNQRELFPATEPVPNAGTELVAQPVASITDRTTELLIDGRGVETGKIED